MTVLGFRRGIGVFVEIAELLAVFSPKTSYWNGAMFNLLVTGIAMNVAAATTKKSFHQGALKCFLFFVDFFFLAIVYCVVPVVALVVLVLLVFCGFITRGDSYNLIFFPSFKIYAPTSAIFEVSILLGAKENL